MGEPGNTFHSTKPETETERGRRGGGGAHCSRIVRGGGGKACMLNLSRGCFSAQCRSPWKKREKGGSSKPDSSRPLLDLSPHPPLSRVTWRGEVWNLETYFRGNCSRDGEQRVAIFESFVWISNWISIECMICTLEFMHTKN